MPDRAYTGKAKTRQMGEVRKRKKRTGTPVRAKRRKGKAGQKNRPRGTRGTRGSRSRHLLLAVLAVAAVLVIAVAGVVIARRNRAEKEADAAASSSGTTDAMNMPFSEATVPAREAAAEDTGTLSGQTTQEAQAQETTHVNGIRAFALYRFDEQSGMRVKTARHESAWTRGQDIVSLEAFAKDTESFAIAAGGSGAWYEAWQSDWYAEEGAALNRIGYRVTFRLTSGEEIDAMLLKPGDELSYRPYLENYLYDDAANANAGWYSHLEPDDLNEQTLLTSIKFTPGERVEEIEGNITVTAFVYDSVDDFDYDGAYTGDVLFTTEIVNTR